MTIQRIISGLWALEFALVAVVMGMLSHVTSGAVRDLLLVMDGLSIGMMICALSEIRAKETARR